MGRITRPFEPAVPPRHRLAGRRWIRLLRGAPLLPTVAGVFAAVVVVTAISSSQVSLTFANNPPPGQPRCTGAGCEAQPYDAAEPGDTGARPAARDRRAPTHRTHPARPAPSRSAATRPRAGAIGPPSADSPKAGSAAATASPRITVAFKRAEQWSGGYVSTATITNRGRRPVGAWTLAFTVVDGSVTYAWEVDVIRTGERVTVRNRPGDPAIAPGQSVEVGFAAEGTYRPPRNCTINGHRC
jgi:hypothetical protein